MKRDFQVGDVTRSTNSRWPLLNHRLVQITYIDSAPRYEGKPYLIRRVDGLNWVFPSIYGDGKTRGVDLPEVWCRRSDLVPIEDVSDTAPVAVMEVSS